VTWLPRQPGDPKRRPADDGEGLFAFDLPTLLELFDGDQAAIGALLAAAIAAIRRDAELLEVLVAANDRPAIVETTHRLKGTGGTIGAQRLVRASSNLEDARPAAASQLFAVVRAEVTKLTADIDAFRAEK